MKRQNYRVKCVTVEMPAILNNGLNEASTKYKLTKSDIIRSIVYDFLISSGVIPENKDLNRPEDIYIDCVGRLPTLLSVE